VPALAGGIFWVVEGKTSEKGAAQDALAPWIPSESKPDPSTAIPGIYVGSSTPPTATTPATYPKDKAADHVSANQRVAYDRYPPVGGPHDVTLASCNGVDYTKAVRNENMAHSLEHGAVWIAYSPDTVTPADLPALTGVQNQPYMSLSPYPGLDSTVSLQAWAHQLKVNSASDPRIAEFLTAFRQEPVGLPGSGRDLRGGRFQHHGPTAIRFEPARSRRGPDGRHGRQTINELRLGDDRTGDQYRGLGNHSLTLDGMSPRAPLSSSCPPPTAGLAVLVSHVVRSRRGRWS